MSPDVSVFTPANTLGTMLKLKADITAGADYVQEVRELPADPAQWKSLNLGAAFETLLSGAATTTSKSKGTGHYAILAQPDVYHADSLKLLTADSRQFARALRQAQGK